MAASKEGISVAGENTCFENALAIPDQENVDILLKLIDSVEAKAESMRERAIAIAEEKQCLLQTLHSLQTCDALHTRSEDAKEELSVILDRLIRRCLTVEVAVITPRTSAQEAALEKVTSKVNNIMQSKLKPLELKTTLMTYFNACVSEPSGPVNYKFQEDVIACALDDQKRIRKQLEHLLCKVTKEESMLEPT